MERPKHPYSTHSRPTTKRNRRISYAVTRSGPILSRAVLDGWLRDNPAAMVKVVATYSRVRS
jgi:hypothetical protein